MLASEGIPEKYRQLIAQYNQNLSRRKYLHRRRHDKADDLPRRIWLDIPAGALRINVAPFLLFRDSPFGIIYLQAVATV